MTFLACHTAQPNSDGRFTSMVLQFANCAAADRASGGVNRVRFADLDDDGDLDIYVATGAQAVDCIYISSQGGTVFTLDSQHSLATVPDSVVDVTFGDVDLDGDDDVLVVTFNTVNRLYMNMGGGQYVEDTTFAFGAQADGATAGSLVDVDNDGDASGWDPNARPFPLACCVCAVLFQTTDRFEFDSILAA